MVDQHADPALLAGLEVDEVVGEVVDPTEVLDDDALDAQVVAPDPLDQLGVVATFDEDPAGAGDAGLGVVDGDRARCRARRPSRGAAPGGRDQDHRLAVAQEAGAQGEGPASLPPVLQGEGAEVAVDRDDLAAPVGHDLLDDGADLGGGLDGTAALRPAPVSCEDVGAVTICHTTTVDPGTDGVGQDAPDPLSVSESSLSSA
jgi:hypothetical protein